jgi:hypothetical protein
MLAGQTGVGTITGFSATTTVPASTTVTVQFSRDATTWYNHSGTANASDTLANGTNTINLAALNWNGPLIYYRLQFTNNNPNAATSPTVSGVQITYSPGSGLIYFTQGTLVSTNMLAGHTDVRTITGFSATTIVPTSTAITVQFSRDAVTWYNHSGTANASDTLVNGANSINLAALNWNGPPIYYRLQFTNNNPNAATSPTVSGVQINYSPGSGSMYFSQGTMVSKNLLAGTSSTFNATGMHFGYTISSMPSGTAVSAEFSKDGTNFYNASGTLWGWTPLAAGNNMNTPNSLNLSGFGWATSTAFYYKLQFTSTATGLTPVVSGVGLSPAPSAPSSFTVGSPTTSTLSLAWASSTPNNGATISFYAIYRGISTSTMSQIATTNTLTFMDSGLAAGTTYFYYVTAQDSVGNVSASSSVASGTTTANAGNGTGTLDSETLDTGVTSGAEINAVTWQGNQPSGTMVGFQFAVSSSSSGPWNFAGPDGTSGTMYTGLAGAPIPLSNYSSLSGRYFRYRVILSTNSTGTATPRVQGVDVNWSP